MPPFACPPSSTSSSTHPRMEELQARHRQEQRDLVAKSTQKKKAATKKTRKGINDECANLERELKDRHEQELAALNPAASRDDETPEDEDGHPADDGGIHGISDTLESVSLKLDDAPVTASAPPKKRNRQRDRLARRAAEQEAIAAQAAEEAANMPDLREQERLKMAGEFQSRGLEERVIRADGHCLYSAVADQLEAHSVALKPSTSLAGINVADSDFDALPRHVQVRSAAAAYIRDHADDFVPFLEEPLDDYVHKIKDTSEWGGQLELTALAKTYKVPINVIQGVGRVEKIDAGEGADEDKSIWLAYYRHGFGLGEHYNSLRKTP